MGKARKTTATTSNDHAKPTHLSRGSLCFISWKTKKFDQSTCAKAVTSNSKMARKCQNLDANNNLLLPATLLMVQETKNSLNNRYHNYVLHQHHRRHNYHHHHHYHHNHDNNHQQTTKPSKLRPSFVRLTMIVLFCLTTSDTRWSQVKAQTSLLGSPMYLSSSSMPSRSSNQAAGNMAADTSGQSSILKRDLSSSTIKQQQLQLRNGKLTSASCPIQNLLSLLSNKWIVCFYRFQRCVLPSFLPSFHPSNFDFSNDGRSTIAHLKIYHPAFGQRESLEAKQRQ